MLLAIFFFFSSDWQFHVNFIIQSYFSFIFLKVSASFFKTIFLFLIIINCGFQPEIFGHFSILFADGLFCILKAAMYHELTSIWNAVLFSHSFLWSLFYHNEFFVPCPSKVWIFGHSAYVLRFCQFRILFSSARSCLHAIWSLKFNAISISSLNKVLS